MSMIEEAEKENRLIKTNMRVHSVTYSHRDLRFDIQVKTLNQSVVYANDYYLLIYDDEADVYKPMHLVLNKTIVTNQRVYYMHFNNVFTVRDKYSLELDKMIDLNLYIREETN